MSDTQHHGAGMYSAFLVRAGVERVADIIGRTLRKPCAIIDGEGKFLWANRAWCAMLEYTFDELIRYVRTDKITTAAEDITADREQINRLIAGDQEQYELVKFYQQKSGDRIQVRVIVTRYPNLGSIDWLFMEAEVLGDEYREAFLYATDQVTLIAKAFSEKHTEVIGRVDKLLVQQQQTITALEQSQWVGKLIAGTLKWVGDQYTKAPVNTTIAFLILLTLIFGARVVEVTKEVFSLFPTVQVQGPP